jgi:hypothetical protein
MEMNNEDELQNLVMTKKRFQGLVEETVRDLSLNYLDAIIHLCEKYKLEPEDARKYISPVIKDKLEAEATRLRFIQGGDSVLPID